MWNIVLAQAQEAANSGVAQGAAEGAAQTPQSPFSSMLPMFVAMIAIFYFLIIRPNQKREKERRELLASVAKGDRVITSGGVCGTVVGLSDKTVVLRVSEEPNVKIEFLRGAISQVTSREEKDGK